MKINQRLLDKFKESSKIKIENNTLHFKIIAKMREKEIYLLYENWPFYPEEVGIPKEYRLKGSAHGTKFVKVKDRPMTDLEKLHLKFLNWLINQFNTTLFSF